VDKGAIISPCGQFRYRLWRRWSSNVKPITFVMLNPSTADAEQDDPTIRKCIGFAKRIGQGAIEVVNLYAYRATDPAELKRAGWPKGPENDRHILDACADSHIVICAWGANARGMDRPRAVLEMLRARGIQPKALALTGDGMPRHPLYIPYDAAPVALRA
jgi:hypothetical protein